jgi:glycosyltransferase involved in cell wall biosynthesis
MSSPSISIVIPTCRRPGALARAAASALAQEIGVAAELVVVDNDPAGSAAAMVSAMAEGAPIPVRYVHAPEPGVANARNVGVDAARGEFIAFLDDDEAAPPGWLNALLATAALFDADAVFGPVRTLLPDDSVDHAAYFELFFARTGPASAQIVPRAYGCGCSLVRKAAMPDRAEPFSRARNASGGEDDLMFAEMKAMGARFAWSPDAWVWEAPEPSRLTLAYTLRRAFAYGQGPCSAAAARGVLHWPLIPLWMGAGVIQAIAFGLKTLMDRAIGAPTLPYSLDRAARGVGKLLWFSPFKISFYGRPARRAAAPMHGDRHECDRRLDAGRSEGVHKSEPQLPAPAG